MKILKKLLIFLLIAIIVAISILFLIGYSCYSKALKEKPLISRVETIMNDEHYMKFEELSETYLNAVIAIEDHRYYEHGAVDFISIARAIWSNIKNGEINEGGSTITQQVAKNVVLSQEKTIWRKLAEVFAAYDIEKNYSKKEVLAIYVNTIYFGDGYYGIYDASMGYYGKEPKDLTLDEASMLAGIPNAPSVYSPSVNPDLAEQRQNQVLNAMKEYGYE